MICSNDRPRRHSASADSATISTSKLLLRLIPSTVLVEPDGQEDVGPDPIDVLTVGVALPIVPPGHQLPTVPTAVHHVVSQMRRQRAQQHGSDR